MASGNSDKPTSQYIKDEADQLYKSAQKYEELLERVKKLEQAGVSNQAGKA